MKIWRIISGVISIAFGIKKAFAFFSHGGILEVLVGWPCLIIGLSMILGGIFSLLQKEYERGNNGEIMIASSFLVGIYGAAFDVKLNDNSSIGFIWCLVNLMIAITVIVYNFFYEKEYITNVQAAKAKELTLPGGNAQNWYYQYGAQWYGPITRKDVPDLSGKGFIKAKTPVFYEGSQQAVSVDESPLRAYIPALNIPDTKNYHILLPTIVAPFFAAAVLVGFYNSVTSTPSNSTTADESSFAVGDQINDENNGMDEESSSDNQVGASIEPIVFAGPGNKGVQFFDIPEGITVIGKEAFMGCEKLEKITIPESVTVIDNMAFYDCKKLEAVVLPEGLTTIGDYAFSNSGIMNIQIPEKVTRIGNIAFAGCENLENVTFPEGLTEIGELAFESCISLSSVDLPNSLSIIGDSAFKNCGKSKGSFKITIPNSVTSIGENAFAGTEMKSISVPSSVSSMGEKALYTKNYDCVVRVTQDVLSALGVYEDGFEEEYMQKYCTLKVFSSDEEMMNDKDVEPVDDGTLYFNAKIVNLRNSNDVISIARADRDACTEEALLDWYLNYVRKHQECNYHLIVFNDDDRIGCYVIGRSILGDDTIVNGQFVDKQEDGTYTVSSGADYGSKYYDVDEKNKTITLSYQLADESVVVDAKNKVVSVIPNEYKNGSLFKVEIVGSNENLDCYINIDRNTITFEDHRSAAKNITNAVKTLDLPIGYFWIGFKSDFDTINEVYYLDDVMNQDISEMKEK